MVWRLIKIFWILLPNLFVYRFHLTRAVRKGWRCENYFFFVIFSLLGMGIGAYGWLKALRPVALIALLLASQPVLEIMFGIFLWLLYGSLIAYSGLLVGLLANRIFRKIHGSKKSETG